MKEWVGDSDEEIDWVEYPPVRFGGIIVGFRYNVMTPFYYSYRKLYSFSRQTSFGEFIYEENPDLKKYMV